VFAQIFGAGSLELQQQTYLIDSGRSLLDDLLEEATGLQARLSESDRRKLDEYFTSIRSVEQKLQRRRDWLDRPFAQPDRRLVLPEREEISQSMLLQNEDLMWDLMALAIKNDSTRVMTLNIPLTASALRVDGELMPSNYHNYSHHGNDDKKIAALVEIESRHLAGAAKFLKQLKSSPDRDGGSLLDTTITIIGSAMGDASKHTRENYPLLVAGGGFKHQRHVSCASADVPNQMACDLYVTVLQQLGFEVDQFSTSKSNLNGILL